MTQSRKMSFVLAISVCSVARATTTPVSVSPSLSSSASLTKDARADFMRRAQVMLPGANPATFDFLKGPVRADGFEPNENLTCAFSLNSMGGMTPKFSCDLGFESGKTDAIKVRYGIENREIYGDVLATRLFTALGFGANAAYSVNVHCIDCPADPWSVEQAGSQALSVSGGDKSKLPEAIKSTMRPRDYSPACAVRKLNAKTLETFADEGWEWAELSQVDERAGGASHAQIDALRLLAAFVAHGDSKAEQQKLVCLKGGAGRDPVTGAVTCTKPFLFVTDLGSTFGGAGPVVSNGGKVDFKKWAEKSVWRNRKKCRAELTPLAFHRGTLKHPVVGNEGRLLLGRLLSELSDAQIRDLFTAARVELIGDTFRDSNGITRAVTVDDWVQVFKRRRAEILSGPDCPNP